MDGYNRRGVELLCEVVRARVESLSCPGCGQTLNDVEIELGEIGVDHVTLDVICSSCQTRFGATVAPAGEGGVAVIQ